MTEMKKTSLMMSLMQSLSNFFNKGVGTSMRVQRPGKQRYRAANMPQRHFLPAGMDGRLTQYKDGRVMPYRRPDGVKTRDTKPRGSGRYEWKRRMQMIAQLKEVSARG